MVGAASDTRGGLASFFIEWIGFLERFGSAIVATDYDLFLASYRGDVCEMLISLHDGSGSSLDHFGVRGEEDICGADVPM